MNAFTFFGYQMDGGGKRIGYGPIITFTGGKLTQEWGASKAETLEQITLHDVVPKIKDTKILVMMISRLRNIHQFKFEKNKPVDRFNLQIHDEKAKLLKEIQFPKMTVNDIRPVQLKDQEIGGALYEYSKVSWNEVFLTVDNPGAITIS